MQSSSVPNPGLSDDAFRAALRALVARCGRSLRALSLAMGRDPGYIAALLDPSRPSRARPTPTDLLRLSEATGIPFVELLESLWGIPAERLAAEIEEVAPDLMGSIRLTAEERRTVEDFARFVSSRRQRAASRQADP